MSTDPRAAAALTLLREAGDPAVIAALLPLASGAFHPIHRGRFRGRLAGSHRFANLAAAQLGAYLTDDPDTLAHALCEHGRNMTEEARTHLVTHSEMPTSALLSYAQLHPSTRDGFLNRTELDAVLDERLHALPADEAFELARAHPSERATRALAAHPGLQASHALRLLCEEELPGSSDRGLLRRGDLGEVLARSGSGWDEEVLAASLRTLVEASCGKPSYAHDANAATKALEDLVGGRSSYHTAPPASELADPDGVVRASTIAALTEWSQLAGRAGKLQRLSSEACELVLRDLTGRICAQGSAEALEGERVIAGEVRGFQAGVLWRSWAALTEALSAQPEAPLHVLEALPAAHPRALARVLEGRASEVWVLAASLVADHPHLSAGGVVSMCEDLLAP